MYAIDRSGQSTAKGGGMGGQGLINAQMEGLLKQKQLERALKNMKEGRDSSDNGQSSASTTTSGNNDALADALSKLGTQLASRNGTDGAAGAVGDNGETDFNRQRTLLGDRANQEMESAKLQARLDADRRKQSLGSAMASLSRFR
jgi:hypothetical protein